MGEELQAVILKKEYSEDDYKFIISQINTNKGKAVMEYVLYEDDKDTVKKWKQQHEDIKQKLEELYQGQQKGVAALKYLVKNHPKKWEFIRGETANMDAEDIIKITLDL